MPVSEPDHTTRRDDELASPRSSEEQSDQPGSPHSSLGALVSRARTWLTGEQERLERILAKHEHRPVIDVALRIYRRDRESAGTVVGSAVAFRLFLFFVPLLLFLVGLLGFIATW